MPTCTKYAKDKGSRSSAMKAKDRGKTPAKGHAKQKASTKSKHMTY